MNQSTAKKTSTGQELQVVNDDYRVNAIAKLSMKELKELGQMFFDAGTFNDIKSAAQAMVKIHACYELGFSPIQSMAGIHFFQGKVAIGSTLIASLIKDSGRYDYEVLQHDTKSCSVQFMQKRDGHWLKMGVPVVYTVEDAKNANLTGNPAWKNHPADMLFASCVRKGARRYTPDIFRGTMSDTDTVADTFLDGVDLQAAAATEAGAVEVERENSEPEVIDAEPVEELDVTDAQDADRNPESRIADLQIAVKDEINRITGGEEAAVQALLNGRVVGQMDEKALTKLLEELGKK
jgi:hypothetical protein